MTETGCYPDPWTCGRFAGTVTLVSLYLVGYTPAVRCEEAGGDLSPLCSHPWYRVRGAAATTSNRARARACTQTHTDAHGPARARARKRRCVHIAVLRLASALQGKALLHPDVQAAGGQARRPPDAAMLWRRRGRHLHLLHKRSLVFRCLSHSTH